MSGVRDRLRCTCKFRGRGRGRCLSLPIGFPVSRPIAMGEYASTAILRALEGGGGVRARIGTPKARVRLD